MKVNLLKTMLGALLSLALFSRLSAQCLPPNDLTVTTLDWQHFQLYWPPVSGATGYAVIWQLNNNAVVIDEIPASPTSYNVNLPTPMTTSDVLVIQVQSICENGTYSSQAVTVYVYLNSIYQSELSRPIYIIIDDVVIGREETQNICLSACADVFALRDNEGNSFGSGNGATANGWVGSGPGLVSLFNTGRFCACLSNGSSTGDCLANAYYMEVQENNFMLCSDSGGRTKPSSKIMASFSPNPFETRLVGYIYAEVTTKAVLNVFDGSGILCLRHDLPLNVGANSFELPALAMPEGLLFYQIKAENGVLQSGKLLHLK